LKDAESKTFSIRIRRLRDRLTVGYRNQTLKLVLLSRRQHVALEKAFSILW